MIDYDALAARLHHLVDGERDPLANAANVAALIYRSLPDLNWAGFYFLRDEHLVLGPFHGEPATTRIAVGRGVCGAAVAEVSTIVVDDVHAFPGHIACDVASSAEIVVPLVASGREGTGTARIVGVLDIDSPVLARFSRSGDREGIEALARAFVEACDWSLFSRSGRRRDARGEAVARVSAAAARPVVRIVGLGPGDPDLVTLGALEALRAAGRVLPLLAPPKLTLFLQSEGIALLAGHVDDAALFVRGSHDAIAAFVRTIEPGSPEFAIGVLGNPLSDFPGLPLLLRALEERDLRCEIAPGMPRATLSAAISMPLVPLPPASSHFSWPDLIEVMARLRRGCPWDREQTHRSLVPYLLEESYEVTDAIEAENDAELCEELGDLLLQIVFHAQLATERGKFSVADVVDALANKMIRRHPHVFGDAQVETVGEVWANWEQLKALEPSAAKRESRLDGIPKGLGALQRAQKMQDKAARVGFDWPDLAGVRAKLAEEFAELEEARRSGEESAIRDELGDVIFSLVNFSRALGFDAEGALREASEKFYRRFTFMERRAEEGGTPLGELSPEALDALWRAAKTAA